MHRIEHRIIYADTDAGQVVYYANYFKLFESGRRELLRSLKIDLHAIQKKNILTPVVEAHCNYSAPARYDDVVVVETKIAKITEKSIRFENKICRKKDSKLLASGYTVNVFVDGKKMESIKIPDNVKKKLKLG